MLPTGEKICRKVINKEISCITGVAESYITIVNDKLTAVIVPVNREVTEDRMKKKIDRYNENKGYRWEIQKVVVLHEPLPKLEDGEVDTQKIESVIGAKY